MSSNDLNRREGWCRVCGGKDMIRNINLYVTGSEGLNVCFMCEMNIVEYVRGVILLTGTARKLGYQAAKELRPVGAKEGS